MKFRTYLRNSTEDLSDRQTVGLAMYYLLHEEGRDSVTTKEVREFLRDEPVGVPDENIGKYPSQLRSDGYFDRTDGEYFLTITGEEYYDGLVDLPSGDQQPREDSFLGEVDPPDQFYEALVEDIERTYTHRVYDATLVLTRKLLENLMIDTLRGHYGNGKNKDLFFDPNQCQYRSFSELLDNFEDNSVDLRMYGPRLDEPEFHEQLQEFRQKGNTSAHSITVNVSDEEIEELSSMARSTVPLLFRVQQQLRAARQ
jgi:hypothetical protein